MSGFTTFLGILSLLGGMAELLGMTSLEGALLLIILGAYLIVKPWFEKQRAGGQPAVQLRRGGAVGREAGSGGS